MVEAWLQNVCTVLRTHHSSAHKHRGNRNSMRAREHKRKKAAETTLTRQGFEQ